MSMHNEIKRHANEATDKIMADIAKGVVDRNTIFWHVLGGITNAVGEQIANVASTLISEQTHSTVDTGR